MPEFELWFATPATTPFFAEVVLLLDDVAAFVETDDEVFFAEATELVVLAALLDELFVVSELVVAVAFLLDATDELLTLLELFLLLATDELFTLLELFLLLDELLTDELDLLLDELLTDELDLLLDELLTDELDLLLDTAELLFTLLELDLLLEFDDWLELIANLMLRLAMLVSNPTMFCHGFF